MLSQEGERLRDGKSCSFLGSLYEILLLSLLLLLLLMLKSYHEKESSVRGCVMTNPAPFSNHFLPTSKFVMHICRVIGVVHLSVVSCAAGFVMYYRVIVHF